MFPLEPGPLATLIALMIPVLAALLVLGVSFAIVGAGHRRAWVLCCPLVAITWTVLGGVLHEWSHSRILTMFWGLASPAVLCVGARFFRGIRERGSKDVHRAQAD